LDKGEQCTKESTKKHDFWHEGEHQKAQSRSRFLARGRAPKSTIFGTRESTKKHDFVHEGEHQKARSRAQLFARGKAPKSTILCTILCTKEYTQNNARPKYKEIIFFTVTAFRTDSRYTYYISILASPETTFLRSNDIREEIILGGKEGFQRCVILRVGYVRPLELVKITEDDN